MEVFLLTNQLKPGKTIFHPIVDFIPGIDKLTRLDFTAANTLLSPDFFNSTSKFTSYINQQLQQAGAKYGIGGYGEHRTIYLRSDMFGSAKDKEEPRRLHLGIDIWGRPNVAVKSPLDGLVHSFAYNDNFGDYGGTIILTHLVNGISFHTLYGHLSLNSIKNISVGDRISKGDIFCDFGIPSENGSWPPHLHFQLILDIGNYNGDYPGVCKFSEREKYLANSPDPDIILQLNQYL